MARKRHTPQQIIRKLREAEVGLVQVEGCLPARKRSAELMTPAEPRLTRPAPAANDAVLRSDCRSEVRP